MKRYQAARFLILGMILLWVGTAVSCNTSDEREETAVAEISEVDVPDEVMVVRGAALEHLRTIAQIMVPPESTPWQSSTNTDFAETGTSVYLFSAEADKLSVSYPSPATEDTLFYVALRNAELDFCWQGFIDAAGEIQSTGYDMVEPGLTNPSALYCADQGYTFEIRTREDGKQCGACVFSAAEDDVCNAWDYFYGTCSPSK
jgi:putative hemolysin